MKHIRQSDLNKMPVITIKELEQTSNSIRNYYVYLGSDIPIEIKHIHIGLASENHYLTIQKFVNNEPIYKILLDNRKM